MPDMIKGIAKPREYDDNKKILLEMFSSIAAIVKIDPRIGPMQGVQPNPKAAPTNIGKTKWSLCWLVKNLKSLFINCKLKIPISWNANKIIIIPAIILKVSELFKKNLPINEAAEPSEIKTKEKPKVKKIVLRNTNFFFSSTNLLNDIPEI